MEDLALAVRTVASALVCAMALGKLASPRAIARVAWRPRLSISAATRIITLLAIAEAALSMLILFSPFSHVLVAALSGAFFGIVTTYGLTALARRRPCACGGLSISVVQRRTLLNRNGALAAACCGGVLVGPPYSDLAAHPAASGVVVGVAPIAGLVLLLVSRAVQQVLASRRHIARISRSAPRPHPLRSRS
jgi:hypothetical protein